MAIYNRRDYKTALPQLEKQIKGYKTDAEKRINDLEERTDIFMATVNETKYSDVVKALKDGKIVFARVSNSYGTYNIYPYAHQASAGLVFTRTHYNSGTPQVKFVILDDDDTWTTTTVTLATT